MSDHFSPRPPSGPPRSKGQRTAARIIDAAELLFAEQGYAATSLRQIAEGAGIREPGIYNHFAGKQELYNAVLDHALAPLTSALSMRLQDARGLPDYTDLPALLTDLLLQRPQRAALLLQALADNPASALHIRYQRWLLEIFNKGVDGMHRLGLGQDVDRQSLLVNLIAILNLTAGYVRSGDSLRLMGGGDIADPANVARQKALLHKVIRAMLIS